MAKLPKSLRPINIPPRPPRKRRPPKGGEPEFAPVEPPKPRPLTGGAAVELEFDE